MLALLQGTDQAVSPYPHPCLYPSSRWFVEEAQGARWGQLAMQLLVAVA
jgi:hypothetical protein